MSTSAESDPDHVAFGKLVRERRKARGWSQEALAAEAFSNSERKGHISQIENGKVPNITRDTVRNIARVLTIDPEHIPPALRWPEASAVVKDTNSVVHDIQRQIEEMAAARRDLSREFGIKEGMLIALAWRYAEGSPGDFDAALRGLERALEVARDERERGRLPSNLSKAVDAVIARIDALNEQGDLDGGQAALDAELAALDDEDERRRAERARLYDKGLSQALLLRSAPQACRFILARFDLDAPHDTEERYQALRAIFLEWYQRGDEKGLNFDLEVAIEVAQAAVQRAATLDHRGAMRTNLGNALQSLGQRESGTARLEAAVDAYNEALKERTRERVPLDWAGTQNNLGIALQTLGERESGTTRLEAAVAAYHEAMKEQTRERVPLDWAMTHLNLGSALQTLGKRESGTERLEAAVAAYREALKEYTRERVPLDWAKTQTCLGNTLKIIGERRSNLNILEESTITYLAALVEVTRDSSPFLWAGIQYNLGNAFSTLGLREGNIKWLNKAVEAYHETLKEWTRERVPLYWAMTMGNRAATQVIIAERTGDVHLARQALEDLTLAAQVSRDGGHGPNAEMYESQAQEAKDVLARLEGKSDP